jgi:hypothetical protein
MRKVVRACYSEAVAAGLRVGGREPEPPWNTDVPGIGKFIFLSPGGTILGFESEAFDQRKQTLRDVDFVIQDAATAVSLATPIAHKLDGARLLKVELTEDVASAGTASMSKLGSAVCTFAVADEPEYLTMGNSVVVRLDRHDAKLLAVEVKRVFRPRATEVGISPAEAAAKVATIVEGWKSPADRRTRSVKFGYGFDAEATFRQLSDAWPDYVDAIPAYRVDLSDDHDSYIVLAALDGRLLEDGRRGK